MEKNLKEKELFLLDMDGTIYLGDQLFDGSKEFIDKARKKGRAVFLTNNSSRGVESYIEKMKRLGIETSKKDFITSVDATIYYLREKYGETLKKMCIYVMGTGSLTKQLKDEGLRVISELSDTGALAVDMVLLGFDRELTFRKLEEVSMILTLKKEIPYFATNPDWVCPTEFGYVPDCGSMAEMLEHATGRRPEFIGKPSPLMVELALDKFGYSKEKAIMVGDRIYTDIASGVNAGIDTLFVLSGEGTREDIAKYQITPTFILDSIKDADI